jgi:hypothetical protein
MVHIVSIVLPSDDRNCKECTQNLPDGKMADRHPAMTRIPTRQFEFNLPRIDQSVLLQLGSENRDVMKVIGILFALLPMSFSEKQGKAD